MNLTPKRELLIKLFSISILVFLCIAVWYNGKDLTCNNCNINFESYKTMSADSSYKVYQNFSTNIYDLYYKFLEGECLVVFDEDNGYYLKGKSLLPR